MNFIIFHLENGSQVSCDLANLSRFLSPNCEIVRIIGDKHEAIGYVSHKTLVHFAVEWADYALQNYSKSQNPKVQNCIDLTRKWVQDQSSVSADQLKEAADAADAASDAANAAHYAADAASDAAHYAAHYAAYATNAAANAAYNAADTAAGKSKNKLNEKSRQGNFILKFFEVE